jgi:hypothetical protein
MESNLGRVYIGKYMSASDFNVIFISAFAGLAISLALLRGLRIRPPVIKFDDAGPDDGSSIIISIYTTGAGLQKVSDGTLLGLHYDLLITTDESIPEGLPDGIVPAPSGQIIMNLGLPEKSSVHIAGFSLKDETSRYLLSNTNLDNAMTTVKLEGDFPDHFKLYCTKDRELELLEILDPTRSD